MITPISDSAAPAHISRTAVRRPGGCAGRSPAASGYRRRQSDRAGKSWRLLVMVPSADRPPRTALCQHRSDRTRRKHANGIAAARSGNLSCHVLPTTLPARLGDQATGSPVTASTWSRAGPLSRVCSCRSSSAARLPCQSGGSRSGGSPGSRNGSRRQAVSDADVVGEGPARIAAGPADRGPASAPAPGRPSR